MTFAASGDPSAIIELMGQVDPLASQARYTLLVEAPDEQGAAVTVYGHPVDERLAAEALDGRPSSTVGAFWHHPKVTVTSGTELLGL